MYIARKAEDRYTAAVVAEAIPFIDNLGCWTIKGLATRLGVSEKQIYHWKQMLREEGLRIFERVMPGRRKKDISDHPENEQLLIYETINRLLVKVQRNSLRNRKFSPAEKAYLLCERNLFKDECGLTYEQFSGLIGIDSGNFRLWARRVKVEGVEGLQEKSRAPKSCPNKLPEEIITEIVRYGARWRRGHRGIHITEFAVCFRFKYRRLLRRFGKSSLSDKAIARYLKEAGLYCEKKGPTKGQRGNFRYYFAGAQSIIDTRLSFSG